MERDISIGTANDKTLNDALVASLTGDCQLFTAGLPFAFVRDILLRMCSSWFSAAIRCDRCESRTFAAGRARCAGLTNYGGMWGGEFKVAKFQHLYPAVLPSLHALTFTLLNLT
jgi:hypothetical protein